MNNYLRLLLFVIIYVLFVIRINFLNIQIDSYNLEYYSGKDNGVFKLFESIIYNLKYITKFRSFIENLFGKRTKRNDFDIFFSGIFHCF